MFENCKCISAPTDITRAPIFKKVFEAEEGESAVLRVGSFGIHEVFLNGEKVGDRVLAPGWQDHKTRICAFEYKLEGLGRSNELTILLTSGWFSGRIAYKPEEKPREALVAEIELGDGELIVTDESWDTAGSGFELCDIYDGLIYDAGYTGAWQKVDICSYDTSVFVSDTTVPMREVQTVFPVSLINTPRGEKVLDFGINMVGYPVFDLSAKAGEKVSFSFAEILVDGSFYNENYRSAKCLYEYVCKDGEQSFTPRGTYYGWRYLRIDEFPEGADPMECVRGRFVCADMKRTGYIRTGNTLINRLFDNTIRSQLGNYLAVPTDCPQRDERLGWAGDAQIFAKAAAYNFDIDDFMKSWFVDVVATQTEQGTIHMYVPVPPCKLHRKLGTPPRSAWSDMITIIPWELYMTYGDTEILRDCFDAMKKHIAAMGATSTKKYLFTGCPQFGDWLGLDSKEGSYHGASSDDIVSSAYYAYSTELVIKIGKVIGEDVSEYEELYKKIRETYIKEYEAALFTQTELVVTVKFGLTDNKEMLMKRLVENIHTAGDSLKTGFVGTPYILHVLSENGESELAYKLLLRTDFPSWLYPITMGATTIWEHWDGLRPDGKLWSTDMNSYNHYAYGAVVDWIYSVAAGIRPASAGYERAIIAPVPNKALGTLDVAFESRNGRFESSWYYEGDTPHYRIVTPVATTILVSGRRFEVEAGEYVF